MTADSPQQQARQIAAAAKEAAARVAAASAQSKDAALRDFAALLREREGEILQANAQDMANAGALSPHLQDRLLLNPARVRGMAAAAASVADLPDPVGQIDDMRFMPSGIQVGKMRVPLGVLLMIYEARPNVTADAGALAIKAGNAIILRGGSEAKHSNAAIAAALDAALARHGLQGAAVAPADTSRELATALLQMGDLIDMVIPRGGKGLVKAVAESATMPALKHLDGNCHVYVDDAANIDMAVALVENAKTRRYGVCNAAEGALVHAGIAAAALPAIASVLRPHGVEIRACDKTRQHIAEAKAATEEDWETEYAAPIISIKVAESLDAAIAHINRYGSGHTDAIVTENLANARRFLREVDSSSVLVNASTGFADGGEFGLGAEIGISTNKLHARGPVGALGLTTQKYVAWGDGHCRQKS